MILQAPVRGTAALPSETSRARLKRWSSAGKEGHGQQERREGAHVRPRAGGGPNADGVAQGRGLS
jgi:hypothetical protein